MGVLLGLVGGTDMPPLPAAPLLFPFHPTVLIGAAGGCVPLPHTPPLDKPEPRAVVGQPQPVWGHREPWGHQEPQGLPAGAMLGMSGVRGRGCPSMSHPPWQPRLPTPEGLGAPSFPAAAAAAAAAAAPAGPRRTERRSQTAVPAGAGSNLSWVSKL